MTASFLSRCPRSGDLQVAQPALGPRANIVILRLSGEVRFVDSGETGDSRRTSTSTLRTKFNRITLATDHRAFLWHSHSWLCSWVSPLSSLRFLCALSVSALSFSSLSFNARLSTLNLPTLATSFPSHR
jgi:hypothetical protein